MQIEARNRLCRKTGQRQEMPEIDAFLFELAAVCKKHGLSISHEDGHGAFEVENYDEKLSDWLMDAIDSWN